MLIFGWGDQNDVVGVTDERHCPRCNNTEQWVVYKSKKRIKVMFIPVAKWAEHYAMKCPICPLGVEVSAIDAHRLVEGQLSAKSISV